MVRLRVVHPFLALPCYRFHTKLHTILTPNLDDVFLQLHNFSYCAVYISMLYVIPAEDDLCTHFQFESLRNYEVLNVAFHHSLIAKLFAIYFCQLFLIDVLSNRYVWSQSNRIVALFLLITNMAV